MPDSPLSLLDDRQQRLLSNARRALEKGNIDYVVAACGEILIEHPGCLPVRQLQRVAQLRLVKKSGWIEKAANGLTNFPFTLGSKSNRPEKNLARAEKLLATNPRNVSALKLLAEASRELDWPETAAFALQAIREIDPDDRANLLALGEAWFLAEKPDKALQIADVLLRQNSVDGEAQSLMRKASIARTTDQGRWDGAGDYREKLKDEAESIALEKQAVPAEMESRQSGSPKSESDSSETATKNPLGEARELVARYPGDLDGRFRLAELLSAAGDSEAAIAEYQQTQKNPKLRAASLLGMARCFRARGLTDLAISQLVAAKAEQGTMNTLKKEIIYELGCCYESLGQTDAAIAEFKEIYTEDIGFRDIAAKINAHYSSS